MGITRREAIRAASLLAGSLIFVLAVVAEDQYSRNHWVPSPWIVRITSFSGIAFAAVAIQFRRHWRRRRFWIVVAGLVMLHSLAVVMWTRAAMHPRVLVPLPLLAAAVIIEVPILCGVLYKAGFSSSM
jgi:cytochrome bd-type quinol oxidase subunit 2